VTQTLPPLDRGTVGSNCIHILVHYYFCRRTEQHDSESVTQSLMELRQVLHSQVKHSEETMQTLVTSSTKVDTTRNEMNTIGSNVKIGSRLISKFNRREFTDKVLLFLCLVLFFGVVLYILKKRLLGWIW